MKTFAFNKSGILGRGNRTRGKALLNDTNHHLCTVPGSCQLTSTARNFTYCFFGSGFFFFVFSTFHITVYLIIKVSKSKITVFPGINLSHPSLPSSKSRKNYHFRNSDLYIQSPYSKMWRRKAEAWVVGPPSSLRPGSVFPFFHCSLEFSIIVIHF